MWAIEDSPGPKAAYRGGWYHFEPGYTTESEPAQCMLFALVMTIRIDKIGCFLGKPNQYNDIFLIINVNFMFVLLPDIPYDEL